MTKLEDTSLEGEIAKACRERFGTGFELVGPSIEECRERFDNYGIYPARHYAPLPFGPASHRRELLELLLACTSKDEQRIAAAMQAAAKALS